MFTAQKTAMESYYQSMQLRDGRIQDEAARRRHAALSRAIESGMEEYLRSNPHAPSCLMKSHLHTLMAQRIQPVLFAGYPFYFETGLREGNSWGLSDISPAGYVKNHINRRIDREHPFVPAMEKTLAPLYDLEGLGLCQMQNTFDIDHHTLGYTALFQKGAAGLIQDAQDAEKTFAPGSPEQAFCQAAAKSLQALVTIAHRFAKAAEDALPSASAPEEKACLEKIAKTAMRIPENPPATFYEGLCMLLFTREVSASMEGLGISQLGHVDRLLTPLYESDLAAGRITEAEARRLIGLWMLPTDIKFDLRRNSWPETSTCIQLGGCDEDGEPIYTPVTRMFLEEHFHLGLVNPKLNCRYCAASPEDYLETMAKLTLQGHNHLVMINDEVVLDGLTKSGVSLPDARRYVSGGCQETMLEGLGHTEGVAFYASMPRVMDLFLQGDGGFAVPALTGEPETFDAFFESFLSAMDHFLSLVIDQRNLCQQFRKEALVSPLFSATQEGCLASGRDYAAGGAKYNFSTISLIGLGTVADSLYAVKTLVYDQKRLSLSDFCRILQSNWQGEELLLRDAISLPKYGHDQPPADDMAQLFLTRLAAMVKNKRNERGGMYLPSLFVYYHFESFARCLRATPDGRRHYALISPGAGPGNLRGEKDLLAPIRTMSRMDFTLSGGGSCVLDVKLPLSKAVTPPVFAAFLRACQMHRCPTLQPNVLSGEALLDAKLHPENHQDLVVRICGLSAYFCALTPAVQDEIIARNTYAL